MMAINAILGKKLGMTQIFDEEGRLVSVSVILAGPCTVTQTRTVEKDGYCAAQIGFQDIQEKRVSQPLMGQFKRAKVSPKRYLRELRLSSVEGVETGQEIKADIFQPGDKVSVVGVSKGKGFAGAMKKYHFHGGDAGHGSTVHRAPQSGGATDAARTFKGVRRPGRMGGDRVTAQGIRIVRADAERNLLLVRGSVPGASGGLLIISKQS
jgi:large subunit ribosomal protein L3